MSVVVLFALALGYSLAGSATSAHAQTFTGKWVHQGTKGVSNLEFFPGEQPLVGPTRGTFRHSTILDDGRTVQGDGRYIFRSLGPNRGRLTLHFADGHVTKEHEHTAGGMLSLRHHGVTRTYVRQ
jgi:hypothetical protein